MKPRPVSADEQLFQPVRVDDETDIAADPDPQLETVISDAVSLHRGDVSGDPQGEQMQLRSLCREGHEREPDMAGAQRSTSECKDSVVTHVDALSAESSGLRYSLNAAFTEHMSVQMAHMDGFGHGWGCMRSGWVRQRFRVYGYIRCTFPNIFTSLDAKLANIPRRFKET
jgi:hypothetical protein